MRLSFLAIAGACLLHGSFAAALGNEPPWVEVADVEDGVSLLQARAAAISMAATDGSTQVKASSAECSWTTIASKYSRPYFGLEEAKARCLKLGSRKCKVVSCAVDGFCSISDVRYEHADLSTDTVYVPSGTCFRGLHPWDWLLLPKDWLVGYCGSLFLRRERRAIEQLAIFLLCAAGAILGAVQVKQQRYIGRMCGGFLPASIPGFIVGLGCAVVSGLICHPVIPWFLILLMFVAVYLLPSREYIWSKEGEGLFFYSRFFRWLLGGTA